MRVKSFLKNGGVFKPWFSTVSKVVNALLDLAEYHPWNCKGLSAQTRKMPDSFEFSIVVSDSKELSFKAVSRL